MDVSAITVHLTSLFGYKYPNSHKGENGRVLVIGGSKLFHAASFWSAAMASRLVDMVHFTSPVLENNDLMRKRAKDKFWDGIVVPHEEISHYIEEDDAIS
jgi:NAD(P)H-hydrate repair Nnr-like enzyme with NAD(P)H-hydrate dehydratase domain